MRSKIFLLLYFLSFSGLAFGYQKDLAEKIQNAELAKNRVEAKKWAEEAHHLADQCLAKNPTEAACYYYRGQAIGLFYGHSPFGYVSRVRSMLADWEKALELSPTIDHGGPYRLLAEIYLELPKLFGPKDLRQDLKKAMNYIEKAAEISNYPANHLDKTEILLKLDQKNEAKEALQTALITLQEWQSHPYYSEWSQVAVELKKNIK